MATPPGLRKKQDNSLLGMLLVARDFPVARVQNTILPGHYQSTAGFEFTVIELGLSFDFGYGKQPVAFLCWGAASRVSSRHRRCFSKLKSGSAGNRPCF